MSGKKKTAPTPNFKAPGKMPPGNGMGRVIMVGALPPDHPIYSRGPMIFGRPDPPKKVEEEPSKSPDPPTPTPPKSRRGTFTRGGPLPPDHWLYGAGPIVGGIPILQPRRPYTAEDSARDFKIVRDHLVKTGWKPGYRYVAGKWEPPDERVESDQ